MRLRQRSETSVWPRCP